MVSFLVSNFSRLTLLNSPGTLSLWRHTEAIETDYVSAIKLDRQEPVYYDGVDSTRKFKVVEIELPTAKAERLVVLFRRLYSSGKDIGLYDCLSGLDFICGVGEELRYTHSYKARGPIGADAMQPGEPHIVVVGSAAIHGILATSDKDAIHVAGPNSDLAYTPATDILRIWQGDLQKVTSIH